MANEARVSLSLNVRKGNAVLPRSETYQAAVATGRPPSPGLVVATTGGVNVDLSKLTRPALCLLKNYSTENYVTVGVYDTESQLFFPLLELLPGETQIVRLSRDLGSEFVTTGTGTSAFTNALRIVADTASCDVEVSAFDGL